MTRVEWSFYHIIMPRATLMALERMLNLDKMTPLLPSHRGKTAAHYIRCL